MCPGSHLDCSLPRPWAEHPVKLDLDSNPRNPWDNKCVLFKKKIIFLITCLNLYSITMMLIIWGVFIICKYYLYCLSFFMESDKFYNSFLFLLYFMFICIYEIKIISCEVTVLLCIIKQVDNYWLLFIGEFILICLSVLVTQSCLTSCDPMDCSMPKNLFFKVLHIKSLVLHVSQICIIAESS